MEKIKVNCARCGKNLFFILPEGPSEGSPRIEIKCYKDRCEAINIIDYRDPENIIVRLKK